MAGSTITGADIPRAPERASRPALDGILARAPWIMGSALAVIARLPVGSRLRRRVLIDLFSRSFAAINRDDPWFVPVAYEPDCEIFLGAGLRSLGLAECYRGYAGWQASVDAGRDVFTDLRVIPDHMIDLGDRWVVRLGVSGTGPASGVPTRWTWGSVFELSPRGRIARQHFFDTWGEALAAAGLDGAD